MTKEQAPFQEMADSEPIEINEEADAWRLAHAEAIAELQTVGLERNALYRNQQALRDWAASNHDTGGHSTTKCPACAVLAILESE